MTTIKPEFTPEIGHPVVVKIATDGNGQRLKGGAMIPSDTVQAVYAERAEVKDKKTGEPVPAFNVRLTSGDAVTVVKGDRAWLAVA